MGEINLKVRTPQRFRLTYSAPEGFGPVDHYRMRLVKRPVAIIEKPEAISPDGATEQLVTNNVALTASEPAPVWGEIPISSRYRIYDGDTDALLFEAETDEPATVFPAPADAENQPYGARPYIIAPPEGAEAPDTTTLVCTSYRVAHAPTDQHDRTRWQLFDDGADPDTATPVMDIETTQHLEEYDLPYAAHHGTFQARCRLHGATHGWTPWSPLGATFSVLAPVADQPTAQTIAGDGWSAGSPAFVASAYTSNVDEEPIASRYRLYDGDTDAVVYDSGEVEYRTQHGVPESSLPLPLTAPHSLAAVYDHGKGGGVLVWTGNNYAETTGYRIYRDTAPMDPASLPAHIAELTTNIKTYTDSGAVLDGSTYRYRVSAYNGDGEHVSEELSLACPPLTTTAQDGNGQTVVGWTDPHQGAEEYRIYRDTAPMDPASLPAPLATVDATATDYTDTDVVVGTTYHYRVAAVAGGNENLGSEDTAYVAGS